MHIKRKTIPNFWPIAKTGTKYMAVPTHEERNSIPLIIVIRDLLKLVKTQKELNKIVAEKKVLVNGRIVTETRYPIGLMDSFSIPSIKKFYKATLKDKKMVIIPASESETTSRIFKVINKKQLPGKKVQINLNRGINIITSEKIKVGDFILMDTVNSKIKKIIQLDKDVKAMIIEGKHIGKKGVIKSIEKTGENVLVKIKTDLGEVNTNIKNLFAIE